MKKVGNNTLLAAIFTFLLLAGCSQQDPGVQQPSDLTGNEVTYILSSGSDLGISGTATFKEQKDGFSTIVISLTGIHGGEDKQFPVHLHLGDVTTEDADIASLLQPVDGKTGKSETNLMQLANETSIHFDELTELNACIKIHLAATGEGRNIILAAGNVGSAVIIGSASGKVGFGLCKSE